MSLQCFYQRKFINICHFLSWSNDGKRCLSIQTFVPEQIHQIHFQSVHNLMKIDIVSNCLVVCNPHSNIIYKKITQHTMAYLYALHSIYLYTLSTEYNSVFLKTFLYQHPCQLECNNVICGIEKTKPNCDTQLCDTLWR